jgi:integrase
VNIPAFLVDELAGHLAAFPGDGGLVFTALRGGPLRRSSFRRREWLPAVEASIGLPCRFHDLRHSHAALLIADKAHPKVIQARLGHSSIKTTLDTYGHLFEGLDEAAAERLDASYQSAMADSVRTAALS